MLRARERNKHEICISRGPPRYNNRRSNVYNVFLLRACTYVYRRRSNGKTLFPGPKGLAVPGKPSVRDDYSNTYIYIYIVQSAYIIISTANNIVIYFIIIRR